MKPHSHESSPRQTESYDQDVIAANEVQSETPRTTKRKLGQAAISATETTSESDSGRALTREEEEAAYAEQVIADITRWRDRYDDDERDFIRYTQRVHPQTPEEEQRRRERLLRAEHDADFDWRQMQASTREALAEHAISSDHYAIAHAQRYGEGLNPGETIEAASAEFYDERIQTLQSVIENSSTLSDEEKHSQSSLLRHTWSVVYAYIESTEDLYHDHSGQIRRNQRHNDMIKHLNKINDLARENHVTPLTFRNFMPNDVTFGYQQRLDKGGALWHKAEYDREIVASYFHKVFSKQIAREEAARAARARYMR